MTDWRRMYPPADYPSGLAQSWANTSELNCTLPHQAACSWIHFVKWGYTLLGYKEKNELISVSGLSSQPEPYPLQQRHDYSNMFLLSPETRFKTLESTLTMTQPFLY